MILTLRLDHRQAHALGLELSISQPGLAQQIGPSHLEPDEIVRVVDHAHLIRFGVTHTDTRDRFVETHLTAGELTAARAALLSSRVARSGSEV